MSASFRMCLILILSNLLMLRWHDKQNLHHVVTSQIFVDQNTSSQRRSRVIAWLKCSYSSYKCVNINSFCSMMMHEKIRLSLFSYNNKDFSAAIMNLNDWCIIDFRICLDKSSISLLLKRKYAMMFLNVLYELYRFQFFNFFVDFNDSDLVFFIQFLSTIVSRFFVMIALIWDFLVSRLLYVHVNFMSNLLSSFVISMIEFVETRCITFMSYSSNRFC